MAKYAPPEGFTLDPSSGQYYRTAQITGPNGEPMQHVTWFDPEAGSYTQQCYPAEPTQAQPGAARFSQQEMLDTAKKTFQRVKQKIEPGARQAAQSIRDAMPEAKQAAQGATRAVGGAFDSLAQTVPRRTAIFTVVMLVVIGLALVAFVLSPLFSLGGGGGSAGSGGGGGGNASSAGTIENQRFTVETQGGLPVGTFYQEAGNASLALQDGKIPEER